MNWTEILLAVLGLVGTIDLGRLIFFKSAKKKEEGEAESAAVAPLKEANEIIRQQLIEANQREADLEGRLKEAQLEKDALYDRVEALSRENATVKQYICVHAGCSLRKPRLAHGPGFYEENKSGFEATIDYTPTRRLVAEYEKNKALLTEAAVQSEGAIAEYVERKQQEKGNE